MPLRLTQNIDPFSLRALKLTPAAANGYPLSNATGFVVRRGGVPFVVTNVHVVTGKHKDTGAKLTANQPPPDLLTICHHLTEEKRIGHGAWTFRDERLVGDAIEPMWYEHPNKDLRAGPETFGERVVDVAVLALKETERVELHEVSLEPDEPNVLIRPGLPVSIIGFPFGESTGGLLSDLEDRSHRLRLRRDGQRTILLGGRFDAGGNVGITRNISATRVIPRGGSGEVLVGERETSFFLGIYSGRIRADSDIGIVWRPKIIAEVLDDALRQMGAAQPLNALEVDRRAPS